MSHRHRRKMDKLKTIVQRPFILKADALYSHMKVVAPREKPHNLALVIPIAVATFLVNIGIGVAKDPVNNNIMRAVQNSTPYDNTIKQIVRRAQQHCYKYVSMNLESGMPLVLAFYKDERGGLGNFVKEATIFDHSVDKIIPIRLNSDSAKGKDREAAEVIDATLCDLYIYRKDGKRTKAVGQCNDYGGGLVTKGAAAVLSAVKQQDDAVYYMAACVLYAASKSLQNSTEKNFGESGLGEETFQQFIHTFWYYQEAIDKNFEVKWNSMNPGVPAGGVLDLDSEACISALPTYFAEVEANEISLKL